MKLIFKVIFKILKKILAIALGIAVVAAVLVIVGLNLAKYVIYGSYYAKKEDICINPGLGDGFICQGIAAADRYEKILVSGYMQGKTASRIYVTDKNNESYYVTLASDGIDFTGHAGGIAVTGDNAYIANGGKVYTVPLDSIINAEAGTSVDIGLGAEVNNRASYIYTDDKYIYVGEFHDGKKYIVEGHEYLTDEGRHSAVCSVYNIGDFSAPVAVYSVRDKVQGIAFAEDGTVVMSTSYGLSDSVFYVYNTEEATLSENTLDGAPVYYLDKPKKEVKGPAMSEGLDIYEGRVITLFESASNKYIFGKLFFADKIVSLDLIK